MARRWLLLSVLLLAASCDLQPVAGSFSIVFLWPQGLEPDIEVYIWAHVEERADVQPPGVVLGGAGPVCYFRGRDCEHPERGVQLALQGVNNGRNRRVVVEVRERPSREARVQYYGISEAFTMEPDTTAVVEVALELQRPRAEQVDAHAEVLLVIPGTRLIDEELYVTKANAQRASLNVSFARGSVGQILVAGDSSFSRGARTYVVTNRACSAGCTCEPGEQSTGEDALVRQRCTIAWDLLSGDPQQFERRVRYPLAVHVKLVDPFGYTAPAWELPVTVDNEPPLVLDASLNLEWAWAGQRVRLTVSLQEPLAEEDGTGGAAPAAGAVLRVEPLANADRAEAPPPLELVGPVRIADTNLYYWSAIVEPGMDAPQGYRFHALGLTDRVGNAAATWGECQALVAASCGGSRVTGTGSATPAPSLPEAARA